MSSDHASATIECQDVRKTFSEGRLSVEVLKGVSLAVKPGEQVAIMGSSGSGKSTLLHLLGGLDSCTSGSVSINGELISRLDETGRGPQGPSPPVGSVGEKL